VSCESGAMPKTVKLRRLIWGLICAVVLGVTYTSYLACARYVAAVQAVEQTFAVEMAVDAALSSLKDLETGQRGYVLTEDERFLEPYEAERKNISENFARLERSAAAAPTQAARIREIERLTVEKLDFIDETIRLRREGDLPGALAMISGGRGKDIMDAIRVLVEQVREAEQGVLVSSRRDAHAAQVRAVWAVAVGSVLTLLLALFNLVTAHRDVDGARLRALALATSEEHYRLLADQVSDLVQLLDRQGGAAYVSPSVQPLLGYGVPEFLALPPLGLLHPDDTERVRSFLLEFDSDASASKVMTYRLRHKSGEYRFFEAHGTARRDANGEIRQLHIAARDVTDRKHADDAQSARTTELQSLSLHDELTGLYNRRGFSEMAGKTLDLVSRDGRAAALIFVDLNGMKRINDELGHAAGDTALLDTARLLSSVHPGPNVVARLGGDEFAVLCLDFTPGDLEPLRQRLRASADREAVENGRTFRLSMSAGAAFVGQGSDESLIELVQRADTAMYEAKLARSAAGGISITPPSVEL
jgi:diguanylate cyclase (GGDEF)-like protein/PAS domain S-box-containing protein